MSVVEDLLENVRDENRKLRRALIVLNQACNTGRNEGCPWCEVGLAAALQELLGVPLGAASSAPATNTGGDTCDH